jgi:hypothetical protein
LILNKDPACRLGSRSSEDVFNHPFFSTIDWVALNNRMIVPPFDPCKHLADDIDTTNFEKEFTHMPMYSMEDMEGGGGGGASTASTNFQSSPTKSSPTIGGGPFSQFTFGEDSYLEWIASRSVLCSLPLSVSLSLSLCVSPSLSVSPSSCSCSCSSLAFVLCSGCLCRWERPVAESKE